MLTQISITIFTVHVSANIHSRNVLVKEVTVATKGMDILGKARICLGNTDADKTLCSAAITRSSHVDKHYVV